MTLRSLSIAALMAGLAAPGFASEYKVDTVHTAVIFRVKHMNTSYAYGRFNNVSGTFALDPANPSKSSFNFVVKADSLDTANAARDKHIGGTDYLNAKEFPNITFKSKGVTSAGKDTYEVTGDLTLHGVTKPITVTIEQTGTGKDMRGTPIAGIETTFTVKASEFGIKGLGGALGDEIRVTLSSEGGLVK
jgi:polyisoprenoid-binding protein YceI